MPSLPSATHAPRPPAPWSRRRVSPGSAEAAPSPSRSPTLVRARHALIAASLTLGVCFGAGCQDPSTLFTGVWTAEAFDSEGLLPGVPRLAIGHYGPEATGVVYFHPAVGASERVALCPCAFLDARSANPDTGVLQLTTQVDPALCGAWSGPVALDWTFKLGSDPESGDVLLLAELRASDGSGAVSTVTLVRETTGVAQALRECPVVP